MTRTDREQSLPIAIDWCRDPARAEAIARFFAAHTDPAYISHSELQFGRAVAPGRWSDDLGIRVLAEAERALEGAPLERGSTGPRCALAFRGDEITGLAFVCFSGGVLAPFAVLEDLLVDPASRGQGLGHTMLEWIVDQCRAAGFGRLFLESGLGNHGAHAFFEDHGFAQISVVVMRDL